MSSKDDNGWMVVGAIAILAALAGAAYWLLYGGKAAGMVSPAPVAFITPPTLLSTGWIATPVVDNSKQSVMISVNAQVTLGTGKKVNSSTGLFTLAAGEERSYTAVSLVAYRGSGPVSGTVTINDSTGAVLASAPLSGTL